MTLTFIDKAMIGVGVIVAALEALVEAHGAWPLARIIGYWLGGVLLSFAIAYIATRQNQSGSRFAKFFFWTALASFLLTRL